MLKKTTQQKSVPTFGEAAILIDMMKQDPDYAAKRADFVRRRSKGTRPQERVAVGVDYSVLCDMPLHRDQFTAFAGIPQYFDYDQALRCSRKQGKHLLLYFTSAFSVTSRKMEQDVFTDPAIKKLLTLHFVIANLSVDDDVVNGPENLALLKRFGSENQPTISLCTADGRIINTIGYATREELLEVLQSVL